MSWTPPRSRAAVVQYTNTAAFSCYIATVISLDDVYGAEINAKQPLSFTVFALPRVSAHKRDKASFLFKCESDGEAARWVDVIKHVLSGTPQGGE